MSHTLALKLRFLLDTDTCIFALKHHDEVRKRFNALSPDNLAVSTMNLAELRYGSLRSIHPVESWQAVQAFLVPIRMLTFDEASATVHADLRLALRTKPIGERDLVIASVAKARQLTLVTHNTREFSRVPGLKIDDWTLPLEPK